MEVLKLNQQLIFGDAHYEINKKICQVRLKRPAELPLEANVEKLRIIYMYTLEKVMEIVSDDYRLWDSHACVELRDLVCSRLTLWNARRGGKPSRLSIHEWRDSEENVWMDKDMVDEVQDPAHQKLLSELCGLGP